MLSTSSSRIVAAALAGAMVVSMAAEVSASPINNISQPGYGYGYGPGYYGYRQPRYYPGYPAAVGLGLLGLGLAVTGAGYYNNGYYGYGYRPRYYGGYGYGYRARYYGGYGRRYRYGY